MSLREDPKDRLILSLEAPRLERNELGQGCEMLSSLNSRKRLLRKSLWFCNTRQLVFFKESVLGLAQVPFSVLFLSYWQEF
ncbi:hypothetical protein [Leptospira mayottensis]|uniref:hypothetical protein n=1 Tax=Leptospira mayottensis TaxID=1137606 RepID=UPI0002BE908F|nr:hypothetical protein [Leptospira mayottensis]TGM96179.1 hypothetical protein EHR03_16020 [Leptospira mayottensis]